MHLETRTLVEYEWDVGAGGIKLQKRRRRLSSRNFIRHDAVSGSGGGRLGAYLFMFLNLLLAFGQYLPLSWFETRVAVGSQGWRLCIRPAQGVGSPENVTLGILFVKASPHAIS